MAMEKFRVPTEAEKEVIRRNKIDPEGVAVTYSSDNTIRLLVHKTRDTITINRGEKKWW